METRKEKRFFRRKTAGILLASLLVLSAGGLAVNYAFGHFAPSVRETVTLPGRLADGDGTGTQADAEAAYVELYQGHEGDNLPFEAAGLLPGDTVTQYFCVKVYHDADLPLYFEAAVTEETKNLGDALRIRVTDMDSEDVLCDLPFSEADGQAFSETLTAGAEGESTRYYQVDVYMDTSAGNEYQAAMLTADFHWYVNDEGGSDEPSTPEEPGTPTEPDEPEDPGLTPAPPTGETYVNIALWAVLVLSSVSLLVLMITTRRKGGVHNG